MANAVVTALKNPAIPDEIRDACSDLLTPERALNIALTQVSKVPKLMTCDPITVLRSIKQAASLGVECDGINAYLIPYGRECTLIVSYRGLLQVVYRSGVEKVVADKVCQNDEFVFDQGEVVRHRIDFSQERGECYAYYATAWLANGNKVSEVMTCEQIEKVRKSSKAANSGPWKDWYDEMARKTVTRRLVKWLPTTPESELSKAAETGADVEPRTIDVEAYHAAPTSLDEIAEVTEDSK